MMIVSPKIFWLLFIVIAPAVSRSTDESKTWLGSTKAIAGTVDQTIENASRVLFSGVDVCHIKVSDRKSYLCLT